MCLGLCAADLAGAAWWVDGSRASTPRSRRGAARGAKRRRRSRRASPRARVFCGQQFAAQPQAGLADAPLVLIGLPVGICAAVGLAISCSRSSRSTRCRPWRTAAARLTNPPRATTSSKRCRSSLASRTAI